MSVFQHTSKAKGKVDARRAEYQATFAPDGADYHKAKTRKNAYAIVTGNGVSLPTNANTYDDLYSNVEGKPDVILESVSIEEVADFGMARKVKVKFVCLNRASFEEIEPNWLRPDTPVTIEIGYVDGTDGESFEDFKIGKYGYNLDDKNRYICNFTAYGPGPFVNHLDIKAAGAFVKGENKMEIVTNGFYKSPVTTIPQFMKFVAQGDGAMANIDIPNWESRGDKDVIIIDNPNAITPNGWVMRLIYKALQACGLFSSDMSKKVFCRLSWLIGTIQTFYLDNIPEGSALAGRKIRCDAESSTGAHPIENIGSAYPMSFILAGNGAGYYGKLTPPMRESHLNFDAYLQTCVQGKTANYSNIYISYDYLSSTMFNSSAKRGEIEASSAATIADTDLGADQEKPTYLGSALNQLFGDIYHATGGAVQLALMEDPDNSKDLLIVSRNAKQDNIQETIFDPINGDGITRKCTVSCDPPAKAVYAAMDTGTSKGYAPNSISTQDDIEPEPDPVAEAKEKVRTLMDESLSANDFESEDCDALAACFKTLVEKCTKEEAVELPDGRNCWPLKLEVVLDGASGFKFGDCINSTFLPADPYRQPGLAVTFTATQVKHEVSGQDWSTSMKGLMRLSKKS